MKMTLPAQNPAGLLAGKRIVLTRARGQNEILRLELSAAGAEVIELPCVEFRDLADTAQLDAAIHAIADFDWLFFTSRNAARFFSTRLLALGTDPRRLGKPRPRVAAIGPATAEAAGGEGFPVHFIARGGTGRSFAGSFRDCIRSVAGVPTKSSAAEFMKDAVGMKILVPRSDLAAGLSERGFEDWTEALREAGAEVVSVAAYRTCAPDALAGAAAEKLNGRLDCVVFASPSAFDHFAEAAGAAKMRALSDTAVFAAIGPTTADTIRRSGARVAIEAAEPQAKKLAEAIVHFFSGDSGSSNVALASGDAAAQNAAEKFEAAKKGAAKEDEAIKEVAKKEGAKA